MRNTDQRSSCLGALVEPTSRRYRNYEHKYLAPPGHAATFRAVSGEKDGLDLKWGVPLTWTPPLILPAIL